MAGIPGMAGTEHVGFTVPDVDAAIQFFVEVIGCRKIFEAGPFSADDDWMSVHLGVHPRAVIRRLVMLRCGNGPAFELFQYEAPDQQAARPRNSDHAGHHLAFYVDDMDAAYAYLKEKGVTTMGAPSEIAAGPSAGLRWLYFLAPWGMQLELVSYPQGMAYEKTTTDRLWSPL